MEKPPGLVTREAREVKEPVSLSWHSELSKASPTCKRPTIPNSKIKSARESRVRVSGSSRCQVCFASIEHNPLQNLVQSFVGYSQRIVKEFESFVGYSQRIVKEFEESENLWDCLGRVGGKLIKKGRSILEGDKKRIDVKVYSWELPQGETLAILVSVPPPWGGMPEKLLSVFGADLPSKGPSVRVSFGGLEFPSFPACSDSRTWRTFIPSTPLHQPGPSSISVQVDDGEHENFNGVVVVCPKDYPVESIWLSKSKSKIRGTQKEKDAVKALTSMSTSVQHWSGPFVLPSEGEITTAYGLQRYYNGKFANGYYHRGIDYGADKGAPVRAPSTGRVALVGREADGFEIHGNCVGLDHGHGVTSILMHLSSTFVKEGDIVNSGQVVGLVGDTGIATGPHLHWGFYVNGESVDPHSWMKEQPWL